MSWSWPLTQQLNRIESKLNTVLSLLGHVQQQESEMAINLDRLTQEVAAEKSLTESVIAILQAIPVSTDPQTQAAIDQLTDELQQSDSALAAAIPANTPAAPTP